MPDPAVLSDVEIVAQLALRALVEATGGRFDSKASIPISHLNQLAPLFDTWGRRHGVRTDAGILYPGRPGLWKALDELYPLNAPRRWEALRKAILVELVEKGTWYRLHPPRGTGFFIRSQLLPSAASPRHSNSF